MARVCRHSISLLAILGFLWAVQGSRLLAADKSERKVDLSEDETKKVWEINEKMVKANPNLSSLLRRGSFGGRLTAASKKALLEAYGGTPESEAAVMRGLKWLAAHQQPDGHWSLKTYGEDVEGCDCQLKMEKKVVNSNIAGTAFGVLPFLGAGVAHNRAPEEPPELAEYESVVKKALTYLALNQIRKPKDDLEDGRLDYVPENNPESRSERKSERKSDTKYDNNMYAHALGTIALCEGFGLSGHDRLRLPAQRAIKHVLQAQHKEGGWRYGPRQPGDTSAVAWQFLAIRSGQLGGLAIEKDPLLRAARFIDSCAAGPEESKMSRYSYMPDQEAKLSVTAASLLTRQYLGWKQDMPALKAGVKWIMENLPPESATALGDVYYYYYATQVLHHMEGPEFDIWNARMREHLIRLQEKSGHKAGSWSPEGVVFGEAGGRLYATCMALITLEVYYRHLPMYRNVFAEQTRVIE